MASPIEPTHTRRELESGSALRSRAGLAPTWLVQVRSAQRRRQGGAPFQPRRNEPGLFFGYGGPVVDVVGDSSRDGEWRLVRLSVDRGRIVSADAEGLDRQAGGLTASRGGAVGGDELAWTPRGGVGPIVRAKPDSERVAVADEGGVRQRGALCAPAESGWCHASALDPIRRDGPGRACCSPEAYSLRGPRVTVSASRTSRSTRGRNSSARSWSHSSGLPPRRDPESLHPLQRVLRLGGAEVCAGSWGGASCDGPYARIVEHRGSLLWRAPQTPSKDQSYMLARSIHACWSDLVFRSATRRRTRPGLRRAQGPGGGPAGREPGSVFPRRWRLPDILARQGLSRRRAWSRTKPAARGHPRRVLALHSRQRKGLGVSRASRLRVADRAQPERFVVGRRRRWQDPGPRRRPSVRRCRQRGGEAAGTGRPRSRAARYRAHVVSRSSWTSRRTGRRRPAAVLYEGDVVVGAGRVVASSHKAV